MFPNQDTKLNTTKESSSGKISFDFDFTMGDFLVRNGKVQSISEIEALKIWITKVIKTEKSKFKIYKTDDINKYGATLTEIITSKYPIEFIKSEITREVTESLLKNDEIKEVSNFVFTRNKRILNVTFEAKTIYGVIESEVVL